MYTSSQVATAVGKAVEAVGEDDLPQDAQRKAPELTRRRFASYTNRKWTRNIALIVLRKALHLSLSLSYHPG